MTVVSNHSTGSAGPTRTACGGGMYACLLLMMIMRKLLFLNGRMWGPMLPVLALWTLVISTLCSPVRAHTGFCVAGSCSAVGGGCSHRRGAYASPSETHPAPEPMLSSARNREVDSAQARINAQLQMTTSAEVEVLGSESDTDPRAADVWQSAQPSQHRRTGPIVGDSKCVVCDLGAVCCSWCSCGHTFVCENGGLCNSKVSSPCPWRRCSRMFWSHFEPVFCV